MSSAFNIPDGWALVPRKLTYEMLDAGTRIRDVEGGGLYDSFEAMLAAAPAPPVDAVPGEPVVPKYRIGAPPRDNPLPDGWLDDYITSGETKLIKYEMPGVYFVQGVRFAEAHYASRLATPMASRAVTAARDPHAHWIPSADGLSHRNPAPDASPAGVPNSVTVELNLGSRAVVAEPGMDAMVDRFLSWKLPSDFSPDGGITFKRVYNETSPFGPQNHEPTGTNLLSGEQARAMLEHVVGSNRAGVASLVVGEESGGRLGSLDQLP